MGADLNIFLNKKILIYGLGKSGLSAFKFLKDKSDVFLYDDLQSNDKAKNIKKNLISYKNILKTEFDQIILSPGIDINKCRLKNYLKKNKKKIITDLDIFYIKNPNNLKIVFGFILLLDNIGVPIFPANITSLF